MCSRSVTAQAGELKHPLLAVRPEEASHRDGRRGGPGPLRRLQHERPSRDGAPASRAHPEWTEVRAAPGRQEGRRVLEAPQVPVHREDVSRASSASSSTRTRRRSRPSSPRSSWRSGSTPSYIVVNEFRSILSQVVQVGKLLPLSTEKAASKDARTPEKAAPASTTSTSPTRRRSWRGSCRDTWSSRSTARSPSPPPPRWARG